MLQQNDIDVLYFLVFMNKAADKRKTPLFSIDRDFRLENKGVSLLQLAKIGNNLSVSPDTLQIIETTVFFREDIHYNVAVIQQNPVG